MIYTDDRRVGRFSVSVLMIKEEPGAVAEAFAALSVAPIVVEPDMFSDLIHYRAWAPSFDVVEEPREVPWYDLILTNKDGAVSHEFVKRKPRG